MSFHNEPDTVRCQAMTDTKKRCSYTATHSDGKQALCERHHQMWMVKRANDKPIEKKVK